MLIQGEGVVAHPFPNPTRRNQSRPATLATHPSPGGSILRASSAVTSPGCFPAGRTLNVVIVSLPKHNPRFQVQHAADADDAGP